LSHANSIVCGIDKDLNANSGEPKPENRVPTFIGYPNFKDIGRIYNAHTGVSHILYLFNR
jgi:hypothetical protein